MLLDCRLPNGVKLTEKEVEERRARRALYLSDVGIKELVSFINITNVFHPITDESEIALHNLGILKLEQLGLLDEENLESLLKYMLSSPSYKETSVTREETHND